MWFNTQDVPTLAGMRGRVVVVELWFTWYGPCMTYLPNLRRIQEKHSPERLQVLAISCENPEVVKRFLATKPVRGMVGAGSNLPRDYDVDEIPYVFLIDPAGTLVWRGDPRSLAFEQQLVALLQEKP